MRKRYITGIIKFASVVIMAVFLLLVFDASEVKAGDSLADCGSNLSAQVGGDPLKLTIALKDPTWNNGLMDNFTYSGGTDAFPWAEYRDEIKIIEIRNGVTKISNNAFRDMPNLSTVVLPSSFSGSQGWIGMNAFVNDPRLINVYYDGTQEWWDDFKNQPNGIDPTNQVLFNSVTCFNKGLCTVNMGPGRVDIDELFSPVDRSCFVTTFDSAVQRNTIKSLGYYSEYNKFLYDITNDGKGDILYGYEDGHSIIEVWKDADLLGQYDIELSMESQNDLYGLLRFGRLGLVFGNDLNSAIVTASPSSVKYTGNKLTPNVTVKLNGKTLKNNSDFTLSYVDNVNPGRATIKVKGKGKYTGTGYGRFLVCFKDVPETHSYSKAVYWALDRGIAAGYSGAKTGTFGVSDNVTRGQVIMFLWRAAGKMEPLTNTQTFKDVPKTHNYYKAIQWAYDYGLASGFSDGTFRPEKACTRGQIAVFLWHFAGSQKPLDLSEPFSDVPRTHNYYNAVKWAYDNGITSGYGDGTFGVSKTCTRGHCVTFMYRLMRWD